MADKSPGRRLAGLAPAALGLVLAGALLIGEQLDYFSLTAAPTPPPAAAVALATSTPDLLVPTPVPSATSFIPFSPPRTPTPGPTATPTTTPTPRIYGNPTRLRIPSIGVDAPTVDVGLLSNGQLEAPRQAHQVGWYAKGTKPGEPGNALFDGHLDWYRAQGVFWALGKVEPGQEVIVVTTGGEQVRYVVEWKALYEAEKAPLDRVFGPTSAPSVTLITCGGLWDRTAQSYTHRWVVRATLRP